jgi:hypothetical protein
MNEREWVGDIDSKFTPIEEANASTTDHSQDSVDFTARLSYSQFMYDFHVTTPGPKFVRLFFYPASYSGFEGSSSQDFFTVKANSVTLLRNFSASIYIYPCFLERR